MTTMEKINMHIGAIGAMVLMVLVPDSEGSPIGWALYGSIATLLIVSLRRQFAALDAETEARRKATRTPGWQSIYDVEID